MKKLNKIFKLLFRIYFRVFKTGFVYFGHGVTSSRKDDYIENLHDLSGEIEYLIMYWKSIGFKFISHDELINKSKKSFNANYSWIHLTFDDGYKNNLTELLPILEKYNVPATIFVSTNHIEEQKRFNTYLIRSAIINTNKEVSIEGSKRNFKVNIAKDATRKQRIESINKISKYYKTLHKRETFEFLDKQITPLLTAEQWRTYNQTYSADEVLSLQELKTLSKSPLIHIGSHNHDHVILNKTMSKSDITFELKTSKEWIEKNLDIKTNSYAYPNGTINDFSEVSMKICSSLNYELAFTTVAEPVTSNVNKMAIPRLFLIPNKAYSLTKSFIKKNPVISAIKN